MVPLGIGAHLRAWGVPENRIVELDWDGRTEVAGLTLTCAEARHFSGRGLRRDTTLWSSWAVAGPRHRAYFGGDTGYTSAFARTGSSLFPLLLPARTVPAPLFDTLGGAREWILQPRSRGVLPRAAPPR